MQKIESTHVCFASDASGKWRAIDVPTAMAALDRGERIARFHVNDRGDVLYRVVGGQEVAVVTGAWHIAAACKRIGCRVPESTARRLAELESSAVTTAAGESGAVKEPRMKGTNGKSIVETWSDLFVENEERAKAGKKPWTDAELIAKMQELHPDSAGKTTLSRSRMYRAHYNTGTHTFLKIGSAESRKLPKSKEYGADGSIIEPGSRRSGKKKAETTDGKPDKSGRVRLGKKGKASPAVEAAAAAALKRNREKGAKKSVKKIRKVKK